MIGLTFHKPENIQDYIDHRQFKLVLVQLDKDLPGISEAISSDDGRENILLIRQFDRLFSYVEPQNLIGFKIFIFDNPQNFFRYKFVFADAIPKANGIWIKNLISGALIKDWLRDMQQGMAQESDSVLLAKPWSYSTNDNEKL